MMKRRAPNPPGGTIVEKITPWLWFDGKAEEAAKFYVSVFPNSRLGEISQFGGSVLVAEFFLDGKPYYGLNGGPEFHFTEAVSFAVSCKDQEEVDYYWNTLTADGGEESMCGWLKDKYGLSWQIIPIRLNELMTDPDPERANRTMQAMLQMRKIDIATLERAANGEG
jgi:predicted 3-demethylubiquinone-9 3-methyltransferase (glyoxalase superfamily)